MAVTINLTDLADLQNEPTAVAAINANNAVLEGIASNVLSRDGTGPNSMQSALDMNSNQIYNLPAPSSVNSPARLIDVVSNPTISIPGQGTSGHVVPFLDGNNTWSGTNAHTAAITGTTGAFSGNVSAANVTATTTLFGTNLSVSGAVSLPANSIPLAYVGIVPGFAIVGNPTGSNATPTVMSGTETTALLSTFTSSLKGLAPASGGGTSNFLRADGTWTTPTSNYVLLNTLTASSSATLTDITNITSSYRYYDIVFENLVPATGGGQNIVLQIYSGGAYKTSGYAGVYYQMNGGGTFNDNTFTTGILIGLSVNNVNPGTSGTVRMYNPSASGKCAIRGSYMAVVPSATNYAAGDTGGYWDTAGVVTGFQVSAASGNLTSGTIKIYGIN